MKSIRFDGETRRREVPLRSIKWAAVPAAAAVLLAGCGRKPDTVAALAPASPATESPARIVLQPNSPKLKQIKVQAVQVREMPVDEVIAPGKIEVNPNRVSRVMLPVTGRVVTMLVRIGDAVRQGQPLLLLESSDADTALSADLQAQAGIAQASAAYGKAKADHDRLVDLLQQEAVAKKDVLAAEAALAQAKSSVDQAEAVRRQSSARLELLGLKPGVPRQQIEVHAPISGKVLEMTAVAGEFRNDPNAPVITIADLSSVWASSDVPENQIRLVERGEKLQVELTAYPDRTFQGTVTRISDVVDPNTRTVKVYAELANPRGELKPEMFGRIRHVDKTENLVAVPIGAIVEGAGQSYLYREITPGTFEQTPVRIASRSGDWLGIGSGIAPGTRVVVDGAMLLKGN
jgi:membrane fusion protein, heavy metal efflux system